MSNQTQKKGFFNKIGDFFIPKSGDSQKKKMQKIISLVALVVLIVGIVLTCLILNKYNNGQSHADDYSSLYQSSDASLPPSSATSEPPVKPAAELDPETGVLKELSELYKVNNDLVGFLTIPDTKLKYPVVQTTNEEFYLDHTLKKEYDPFGVPFTKKEAIIGDDYVSTNVTIFGHSAKDGTFFSAVKEYKDVEYYKKHPTLNFDTIHEKGEYKVIGFFMEDVRVTNKKRFNYHEFVEKTTDESVTTFVNDIAKRSYFDTGVDVLPSDQFVTLSTCDTEIDNTNYRVVLVARKVRDGEDPTVDVSKAAKNDDMVMPDGWAKKKGKANPYK